MNKKVSIIIPCREISEYTTECIRNCLSLDFASYEILVLPDFNTSLNIPNIKIVSTGIVKPSEKRDLASQHSNGEFLAFIDEDAYPCKDWLKDAMKYFESKEIAVVVGPAITPENDSLRQKASGYVYTSLIGGGPHRYRYSPKAPREVDDYPTCNFIIRRDVFEKLGGFDTNFWPGEDTTLCLRITHGLNMKIVYDPKVLVYHHRRKLFIPHLRQVWNYSVHRGYFVKKFPETSLRASYFFPSVFLLLIIIGIFSSLISPIFQLLFLIMIAIYLILILISGLHLDLRLIPLIFLGIILTHLVYGVGFIKGLIIRRLDE